MKSQWALKRSQTHEEEFDEGTWALSYGDMITLLLSFFVIFFTTDFDKEKVDKLNRHLSFKLESSILPGAGSEIEKSGAQSKGTVDIKLPDVKVEKAGDMLVLTFGNMSFFKSGDTGLNVEGKAMLKNFAAKFMPYAGNYKISIKGFTDRRPVYKQPGIFRKYEDNLELSALRSISAMRILQSHGIPLNRMEIAGVGELEAISKIMTQSEKLNQDEINALSRTIVIVIKPEQESWI
jgi:chemotaxis protein MotB